VDTRIRRSRPTCEPTKPVGYEELVEPLNQRNLLERIWNGCERYLINDSYDHDPPNWKYIIDLENRTLEMKGVFEHKTTFSFDQLQVGMFDGWREENDPSESWMTDPDEEEEEKLSARKGLAAVMGSKDGDQDEREKKTTTSRYWDWKGRAGSRIKDEGMVEVDLGECIGRRLGSGKKTA
jgi:hypothetical protein